ncbi:MAG TPA: hypothetical protein PLN60_10575 [Bacillota bacterium]|nr:hypothetical protein [Bacillota bacterium]
MAPQLGVVGLRGAVPDGLAAHRVGESLGGVRIERGDRRGLERDVAVDEVHLRGVVLAVADDGGDGLACFGRIPDTAEGVVVDDHHIRCIEEARKDLITYIERKQSEQNATKAIIRTIKKINQRQADILRQMMEHSDEYFTIREIERTHAVVYQTARADLLRLTELGYLKKEKRGREFMFIFNEKCDLWKQGGS